MDTEKAKIYLTAMEEGSFSAAAEKLNYTVSGISRSVASLEDETGFPLFLRGKSGVVPTEDARPLIPVMREMVHQDELWQAKINEIRGLESGSITIGIAYPAYLRIISDMIREFREKHPNIEIRTMQGMSTELVHAVEQHRCDLVLSTRQETSCRFFELRKDPMMACLPEDHPAVKEGIFPLSRFGTEPMIAAFPDQETDYRLALDRAGVRPNIRYSTTDVYAVYCMVESGLGVSLLNRLEVENWTGHVALLPTDPPIDLEIGITAPEAHSMTAAAAHFLQMLGEKYHLELH